MGFLSKFRSPTPPGGDPLCAHSQIRLSGVWHRNHNLRTPVKGAARAKVSRGMLTIRPLPPCRSQTSPEDLRWRPGSAVCTPAGFETPRSRHTALSPGRFLTEAARASSAEFSDFGVEDFGMRVRYSLNFRVPVLSGAPRGAGTVHLCGPRGAAAPRRTVRARPRPGMLTQPGCSHPFAQRGCCRRKGGKGGHQ